MRIDRLLTSTLLIAAFTVAGCTNGPSLIVNSHIDYNKAVRQVMNEELLLNIVRIRYGEAPQFVEVSSINTNFETAGGGGSDVTWLNAVPGPASWGLEGSLTFKDNPTISITPLQGSEISKQLLQSIDPTVLPYLYSAGYRLDKLLALVADNINGVRSYNVGGTLPPRGGDSEFIDVLHAIGVLESSDDIVCGFLKAYDEYQGEVDQSTLKPSDYLAAVQSGKRWRALDDNPKAWALHTYDLEPVIWISPEGLASEAGQVLVRLLHLDPEASFFWLGDLKYQSAPTGPTDDFRIRMRSFYGVMSLLGQAVEVPESDVIRGTVLDLRTADEHMEISVAELLEVYLHVRESRVPPPDAWIAIRCRGNWFYIDDREFRSKRTFTLAIELFNLQISTADGGSTAPILTIPVG